jgi:hypothetical protein
LGTDDIDSEIARTWNALGRDECSPEATWELCRVLEQSCLLVTSRRAVSTVSVGPFRVATSPDKARLTRAFIEGGLPAVVRTLCEGLTFAEAAIEVLLNAFMVCAALAETSAIIDDDVAWCVLVYIKGRNREGEFPSYDDLLSLVKTMSTETSESPEGALERTLDYLKAAPTVAGREPVRLIDHVGANSFESLV